MRTLDVTKHPARGTERHQHSIVDHVGWVAARLYSRTDEEAEQVRAFLSGETGALVVTDATVTLVRDRILTAAIGPNWREHASETAKEFWTQEVREALTAALHPENGNG